MSVKQQALLLVVNKCCWSVIVYLVINKLQTSLIRKLLYNIICLIHIIYHLLFSNNVSAILSFLKIYRKMFHVILENFVHSFLSEMSLLYRVTAMYFCWFVRKNKWKYLKARVSARCYFAVANVEYTLCSCHTAENKSTCTLRLLRDAFSGFSHLVWGKSAIQCICFWAWR